LAPGLPVRGAPDCAAELTLGSPVRGLRSVCSPPGADDARAPLPPVASADGPAGTAAPAAGGHLAGAAGRDHRRVPSGDPAPTAAGGLGARPDAAGPVVSAAGAVCRRRLPDVLVPLPPRRAGRS